MTARLQRLEEFLKEDPDDVFTHYAVALEYAGMNRLEEALAKFRDTIERDPSYVPAHHQLGLLLARMNRPEEAKRAFERGITAATASGDLHARGEMQESLDELLP
jgi:tetratricopeptide (TPR) repeat protein